MIDRAGRFAPSPTGPLHLGSLVAALGSCLDARHRGGRWLVRIDDLDTARVVAGAAERILLTLDAFGFEWDGPVVRQSQRSALYRDRLTELRDRGLLFRCACSRAAIAASTLQEPRCIGDCRRRNLPSVGNSLRVALDALPPSSTVDRSLGRVQFDPAQHADLVVCRRDGVIAYHLAVVVDDAEQHVTDVVRGADLLASTPWQIGLHCAMSLRMPDYLHLPLVTEPNGSKMAKTSRALPLDAGAAPKLLVQALLLLRQFPPNGLERASISEIWEWSRLHWDSQTLHGIESTAAAGS